MCGIIIVNSCADLFEDACCLFLSDLIIKKNIKKRNRREEGGMVLIIQ